MRRIAFNSSFSQMNTVRSDFLIFLSFLNRLVVTKGIFTAQGQDEKTQHPTRELLDCLTWRIHFRGMIQPGT